VVLNSTNSQASGSHRSLSYSETAKQRRAAHESDYRKKLAERERQKRKRRAERLERRASRRAARKAANQSARLARNAHKKQLAILEWRRKNPYKADPRGLGMRTRIRETEGNSVGSALMGTAYWFSDSNPPWKYHADVYAYTNLKEFGDRQEYCLDELHAGPPFRSGGPFFHFVKNLPSARKVNVGTYFSLNGSYKYVGGFFINYTPPLNWDIAFADRDVSFSADGATGWNRSKPGRVGADLGQTFGEIRDVPLMLKHTAKGFHDIWKSMGGHKRDFGPKVVADHWLNTQFGWLPFLNDIRKSIKTYLAFDKQFKQLVENNGQWQRRGCTVRTELDTEVIASDSQHTAHAPLQSSYFYSNPFQTGHYEVRRVHSLKSWFSASFKYYIPDIQSIEFKRWYIQQIFGMHVSPSLVWELTPWSWLVDWFSNAGDVISNITSPNYDGLVAQYAYVMGKIEDVYTISSCHNLGTSPINASITYSAKSESREAASPFGFGLSGPDLTPRQNSILAALGISRLRLF